MPPRNNMRYLNRREVIEASGGLSPVEIIREALVLHATQNTTLPEEAYLGWMTSSKHPARSLALPGALWGSTPAIGLKVINSSLANVSRGVPRAQGLILLFDRETAHPIGIMEAAYISALRTSAYTALSIDLLGVSSARIGIIGCGAIGATHVRLLSGLYPNADFLLYDQSPDRLRKFNDQQTSIGIRCEQAASAEHVVRGAQVIVTTTTTTTGYIPYEWILPGTLIAHVSLDDLLPSVIHSADLIVVDDWMLVSGDERRLLGRLHHAGELVGPDARVAEDAHNVSRVHTTLGDILRGAHTGRKLESEVIVSNPFGMGILDVAVASATFKLAEMAGVGILIET